MSQKNLPPGRSYTRKKIENFSYGLGDTIGKGYSSQVYRGRNDNTEEPVAVKVIDLKMLKCEINRTLLASQIEILKSMKNVPHVLTLHEVYTTKNNTYIITQLCQTDLSSKIKKGISQSQAHSYMNQILQGYSYIVEKGLIHRDLKPANLLITQGNDVKIADFGFGVKVQQVLKPSKYNVGSPLYMAPESLKRNQYSFKTDIWALGIIFFQMLTGDTPWRAKNEKQLLKKIQSEKITDILTKHKFPHLVNQFLSKSLSQDKTLRIGPEELIKYNFKTKQFGSVLGQRQLNTTSNRNQKFQSIINQASSPKYVGRSIQKKLFTHDRSQKKLQPKVLNSTHNIQNLQNMSLKNIENHGKNHYTSPIHPDTGTTSDTMSKQDKKFVSKLLIAEVHFCRFLYKLLGRIKQSSANGLFKDTSRTSTLYKSFTQVIEQKITNLKDFQSQNYLQISTDKFQEYKKTSDYKKLIKIAKDYYQRYSSQLSTYWVANNPRKSQLNYKECIGEVTKVIDYLLGNLEDIYENYRELQNQNQVSEIDESDFLAKYSKDVIILDYLITCKQLFEMIEKQVRLNGCENYEKFAKKSRIEQIVQGSTSEINIDLYKKIIQRGKAVLGPR